MIALRIRWRNKESKDYVDIIPATLFALEVQNEEIQHSVRRPDGASYIVRSTLDVSENVATLAYRQSNNRTNSVWPGVTRIVFDTSERRNVRAVEWQDEGDNHFAIPDPPPSWSEEEDQADVLRSFGDDGQNEIARLTRLGTVASRPNQAVFSTNIRQVYESKCALTRCNTAEVLEAAHIKVKQGLDDNDLRNGILLRADVHALFDEGLIALTLDGRRVDISSKLSDPSYSFLRQVEVFQPDTVRPSEDNIRHHRLRFGFPCS